MSDDLHSLSGAYVLDALTDEERADFEVHLDRCPTCRDEVASLREVAPLLAETVAITPPPSLRADILARARQTRQDPPVVASEDSDPDVGPERTEPGRVIPLRRRWVALAAAAAVVVGGSVATWQVVEQTGTSVGEEVAEADDAQSWRTETDGGASLVVTRSEEEGRAVLRVEGLDDPGAGRTYQAWLQDGEGDLAPAGLMGGDGEMVLDGDVMDAKGVGVSVEPSAGSEQPTSDPIALVELG